MSTLVQDRPNINFHRYYDCIFILVKKEIYRVFLWLYKGGTQYVGDYLKSIPSAMKRLGKIEKAALNRREPSSKFDIPFLYSLLQHTCGLAQDTDDIWNKPRTPFEQKCLEHTLFILKEKRNALCHEPQPLMHMDESDFDLRLNELRDLCRQILREAGKKANRPVSDIDNSVNNMKKAFDDLKVKPIPSGITDRKFALVAKQELRKKHQCRVSAIKSFVFPQIHAEGENRRQETPLKIFPTWLCKGGSSPTCIVLKGETGTGKSTLCRYIYESWISVNPGIHDLQEFDLVVSIPCSSVSTRDLVDFVKGILGDTISWCGRDEARKFLQSLRILWLLDGFEEATVDARELLKAIEKQGASHLMFVTTMPQYCQDLMNILTSKDSVCEVTLTGLSDEGIIEMTEKLLVKYGISTDVDDQQKKFLLAVKVLGNDILKELRVPLKLDLMLSLWLEGKLAKQAVASLYQLYKLIMKVQCAKLLERLKTKCTLRESEISMRITKWVETLHKIAYEMTMRKKFLRIDESSQKILEDKAGNLPINPEDCLSVFLQSESLDMSGSLSYCLMHNTHQYFLAAQHVCFLIRQSPDSALTLKEMFHEKLKSENAFDRSQIYMLLLQVASGIALQTTSDQPPIQTLIDHLKMCNKFDAFEILQYSAYSDAFAKEASKYTEPLWIISGQRAKAALSLLKFISPFSIQIVINDDPEEYLELKDLLLTISKKPIILILDLGFHCMYGSDDKSDSYMTSVCTPNAKSILFAFTGHLSIDGCKYLTRMSQAYNLCLKVSSDEHLDTILYGIKSHCKPIMLTLTFMMPVVKTSISLQELNLKSFMICVEFMDESRMEETAQSLRNIYHEYFSIFVQMSRAAAAEFNKLLVQKNVRVKYFINTRYPYSFSPSNFMI